MDTFPYTGMVMTSSLNSIVTDSAPGMANYVNGNKANNNEEGVFPDDTVDAFDNPRIEYLSEYLHRTKRQEPRHRHHRRRVRRHAGCKCRAYLQPRQWHRHRRSVSRRPPADRPDRADGRRAQMVPAQSVRTRPAPQAINGSQRKASTDYLLPDDIVAGWGAARGAKDPGRDLISDFTAAGYAYVSDKTSMDAAGIPDSCSDCSAIPT